MQIHHIVAIAQNNAIGFNNQMLWHLPNDFKFFKNKTWGLPVIMGRKTYESLGKPLAGRLNIVVTRNDAWQQPGTISASSIQQALAIAEQADYKTAMVIGGSEIYASTLPLAQKLYITKVAYTPPQADAFYPTIDQSVFDCTFQDAFKADEKHAFDYCFETWERR